MDTGIFAEAETGTDRRRTLPPERALKLRRAQMQLAERNLQPMLLAVPVLGALVCVLLAFWIEASSLWPWWLALCATSLRYALSGTFLAHEGPTERELARWQGVLVPLTALAFLAAVYPHFSFYAGLTDSGRMLLYLLACCSLSCLVVMAAPNAALLWTAVGCFGSALVIPPLLVGEPIQIGLAVLGLGLTGLMAYVGWNVHRGARSLFLTREDKNDLIEQLAAAKFESDRACRRAEAASHAKSEFLANMSHELRTPLNAILGFSDIMDRKVFGPLGANQYSEYVLHIHDSGRHLLALINEVLDLARIETGRVPLKAVDLNMREGIRKALRPFETNAGAGRVNLVTEVDVNLPNLHADERAAQQILLNLLSNAIRHTPAGGTVTVFARMRPSGEMEIGVSDTGKGIDPDDIDTLFAGFGKGTIITCLFPRERVSAPQLAPVRIASVL